MRDAAVRGARNQPDLFGAAAISAHPTRGRSIERLAAVHEEAVSAKAYAQAMGPKMMVDLTDVMPGNVLSLAMRAASSFV